MSRPGVRSASGQSYQIIKEIPGSEVSSWRWRRIDIENSGEVPGRTCLWLNLRGSLSSPNEGRPPPLLCVAFGLAVTRVNDCR